jgi:hypothetical protein
MTDTRLATKVLNRSEAQESGCIVYRGNVPILEAQGAVYLAIGRLVPGGMYVRPKCGTERCVNPDHMALKLVAPEPVLPAPPRIVPVIAPTRRRRMKSDIEIRSHIVSLIRTHAQNPGALVHLLAGYVTQLQDLMKRDREDEFAEKVCEHRHPGHLAQGLYCRLCHDAEMAGKFGSLPGTPHPSGDLLFTGDEEGASVPDVDSLLDGIKIKTE